MKLRSTLKLMTEEEEKRRASIDPRGGGGSRRGRPRKAQPRPQVPSKGPRRAGGVQGSPQKGTQKGKSPSLKMKRKPAASSPRQLGLQIEGRKAAASDRASGAPSGDALLRVELQSGITVAELAVRCKAKNRDVQQYLAIIDEGIEYVIRELSVLHLNSPACPCRRRRHRRPYRC